MKRSALALLALSALSASASAQVVPPGSNPVPSAGAYNSSPPTCQAGQYCSLQTDVNGQLKISGSIAATIAGFTPGLTFATLTATATSASVALPAGAVVAFQNTGTTTVSCTLGVGSATAVAGQVQVPPSSTVFLTVGSNTFGACIDETGSVSNVVRLAGGTGLGTGYGGGGGGGGSSAITTWAGGTLGAMANYGTSPGAVLAPGMNAFITNIPAVTQSGTWTVQPGNTANTTAWLVTGTGGTFPVTQASGSVASGAYSAGSFAAGALAAGAFASGAGVDGWDLTQGAKADALCTVPTSTTACSVISILKALTNVANAATPAGTNIIGALVANQSVNLAQVAGVATPVGSGVQATAPRFTMATDSPGIITLGPATAANSVPMTVGPALLGSYCMGANSGTMAAGLAAAAPVFSFRYGAANLAIVRKVTAEADDITTAFVAGAGKVDMIAARSFTASDTGGTAATLTGNNGKLRTSFATTGISDFRISSTATLTAGTRTLDAQPLGSVEFAVPTSIDAGLLPTTNIFQVGIGESPLVLAQNEGFVLQATVPGTGTWVFSVRVCWDEVSAF